MFLDVSDPAGSSFRKSATEPARMGIVKTIPRPKVKAEGPTQDPHHAAAVQRGKAAVRKLRAQGVIDDRGRRIRKDLPADMQEGRHRDFGG